LERAARGQRGEQEIHEILQPLVELCRRVR
jgi:hypothetical protein